MKKKRATKRRPARRLSAAGSPIPVLAARRGTKRRRKSRRLSAQTLAAGPIGNVVQPLLMASAGGVAGFVVGEKVLPDTMSAKTRCVIVMAAGVAIARMTGNVYLGAGMIGRGAARLAQEIGKDQKIDLLTEGPGQETRYVRLAQAPVPEQKYFAEDGTQLTKVGDLLYYPNGLVYKYRASQLVRTF